MALALLREASEELCRKTFEECNTYIKANIPRKYRDEAAADNLIRKALQMKVSSSKPSLDEALFTSMSSFEDALGKNNFLKVVFNSDSHEFRTTDKSFVIGRFYSALFLRKE